MTNDYLLEPLIEPVTGEQPAVETPFVVHMDLELGQERKDLESRRAAKKGLVTMSMVLGVVVGILCNLGGFGGENLFMILCHMRGIDLYENRHAMYFTIAFWSVFTIVSLLTTRYVVLSLNKKILGSLLSTKKDANKAEKGKEGDETGDDEVSSNLDYLDDKFLMAALFGSASVGIVTNIYLKMYLSGIAELVGLFSVFAIDRCCMRKRNKQFYEKKM